jgi:DNA-binding response OmpR family regulator
MNPARILIVEDEEYLRDLYQEVLSDQGYQVDTAQDGNEGLTKIKQGGWDLVMLDIILPGIDGISIMKQIKAAPPQIPNKKIIFLTNLDKDKEMQEGLALGDGYFIKSQITPGNLVDQIKQYINIEQAPNQNAPATPQATTSQVPAQPQIPPAPPQTPPTQTAQQPVQPAQQTQNIPQQPVTPDPNKQV